MFKSIDDKLKDLGFIKIHNSDCRYVYSRCNIEFDYTHEVEFILYESTWIIKSYDPYVRDELDVGCSSVGLTDNELKLFCKKLKQLKRRDKYARLFPWTRREES